ncbi:MAG: hypothetical protein CMH56_14675 [Myxococcales bacterium]|nr:hypothetical protein [Myxococcales bacterium]
MSDIAFDEFGNPNGPVIIVLHGILGSRRNWKQFVRGLSKAHPKWHFVTVDLRHHGDSFRPIGSNGLQDCAQDLIGLCEAQGWWPAQIWGHSFGGKVALSYAQHSPRKPSEVWVLDALPGHIQELVTDSLEGTVKSIITTLMTLETPIASRNELKTTLLNKGFSPTFAAWMTTNLKTVPGPKATGYEWRFNLDAMPAMLKSYADTDFWPLIDQGEPDVTFNFVQAAQSERWTVEICREFENRAENPRLQRIVLEDAGHWVHVDNPQGLKTILQKSL